MTQLIPNTYFEAGGFTPPIEQSVVFDGSSRLTRIPSSGNQKTFVFDCFYKKNRMGGSETFLNVHINATNFFVFGILSTDDILVYDVQSGVDYGMIFAKKFRDVGWYNLRLEVDTRASVSPADKFKLIVNGERETVLSSDFGTPPDEYTTLVNSTNTHYNGYRS